MTDLAIMSSSSVRMTRTLTRPASVEISGAFFALRFRSSAMPRNAESVADPFPDERRVFTDARREDERVEAAERRDEGADPLLHLIAKQRDGLGRPGILPLSCEQIAQIGTGSGHAEQSGSVVHHLLKLRRRHPLGAREVIHHARIQIARAGAHHHA